MQRNLDELGRVVIPKEMRKELNIEGGDPINIELQNNKLIITKPDAVDYKAIVEEAIEYVNNLSSKGRDCEIYWDIKKEILNILSGKKD